MNRRYLHLAAGLIWGLPGIMISVKGVSAYARVAEDQLGWLLLITAGVIVSFSVMFYHIVNRYNALIQAQPERTSIWQTFPLKGWILVVGMSCLGMALKFVPFIPVEFTASFYSGLGPALIIAAIRFIRRMV